MRTRIALATAVTLGVTLALGWVVAFVAPCGAVGVVPRCVVALRPGPVEDVFVLLELDDTDRPDGPAPRGELLLTTVAVDADVDLSEWLAARRDDAVATVPREEYLPGGVDADELAETARAAMVESQQEAVAAALVALDYELDSSGVEIVRVVDDAPADGVLDVGDVVVAAAGEQVATAEELAAAVRSTTPGERLPVRLADGRSLQVPVGASPQDGDVGFLGVLLVGRVDLPVEVGIDAGTIGGTSAGLMFALGVLDALDQRDLVAGMTVAGTGTIDRDGRVGPIGGIRQKVVGASSRDDGPTPEAFLLPRTNLGEARGTPVTSELTVVPVDDLDGAVAALAALRAGRTPADAEVLVP